MTDIEIANKVKPKNIEKIAKKIGLKKSDLIKYGNIKAKINKKCEKTNKNSKLVLVTAINPTTMGNGKTTVSIGLADAFSLMKNKVCLALREPSLGPVFGTKGGATGGGKSQVIPMEDINLHFNGDFHAITSANNLLCSLIDNHIFQGNEKNIKKVLFQRCQDVNDRALREVTICQTKKETPRQEKFIITAASEIMAIMCLSKDLNDLKQRLGNIIVGLNDKNMPVYARDLKANEAMTILLKDALKPNLVQTLKGTPAIIHCGPFANIAHGCNSIIATKTALSLADYCITEAGFGADLGAEKFFDLKCRVVNLRPSCVVLVATIKALKLHGNVAECDLENENVEAVKMGMSNLFAHINAIKNVYKLPLVVTLNKYNSDTKSEISAVEDAVLSKDCQFSVNSVWQDGGRGAIELAKKVIMLCKQNNNDFSFAYELDETPKKKIEHIAKKIYGAKDVVFTEGAKTSLETIKKLGLNNYPVVMAKTQFSLTDNKSTMGAPKDFIITVRDVEIRNGAGFLVVMLGDMLLMPALSKTPAALKMKIDNNEKIEGLF